VLQLLIEFDQLPIRDLILLTDEIAPFLCLRVEAKAGQS